MRQFLLLILKKDLVTTNRAEDRWFASHCLSKGDSSKKRKFSKHRGENIRGQFNICNISGSELGVVFWM